MFKQMWLSLALVVVLGAAWGQESGRPPSKPSNTIVNVQPQAGEPSKTMRIPPYAGASVNASGPVPNRVQPGQAPTGYSVDKHGNIIEQPVMPRARSANGANEVVGKKAGVPATERKTKQAPAAASAPEERSNGAELGG